MFAISDWDVILRLVMACVFGGIVGYERQAHNKSAGLRTHTLVSLGACLVMILSINLYHSVQGLTNADPARLSAQVVNGIGFLGAGCILAAKERATVFGLTTAASLWVVAAIGLAVGAGSWVAAATTTMLVYVILTALPRLGRRGNSHQQMCRHIYQVTIKDAPGQIGKIGAYLTDSGINICDIHIVAEDEQKRELELSVGFDAPVYLNAFRITAGLMTIDGIKAVKDGGRLDASSHKACCSIRKEVYRKPEH